MSKKRDVLEDWQHKPRLDCYFCDLIREWQALRKHDRCVDNCVSCMSHMTLAAFTGGIAMQLGKMPNPLPLCKVHGPLLSEYAERSGIQIDEKKTHDQDLERSHAP